MTCVSPPAGEILRFASGPVGRQAVGDGKTCVLTRPGRLRFCGLPSEMQITDRQGH